MIGTAGRRDRYAGADPRFRSQSIPSEAMSRRCVLLLVAAPLAASCSLFEPSPRDMTEADAQRLELTVDRVALAAASPDVVTVTASITVVSTVSEPLAWSALRGCEFGVWLVDRSRTPSTEIMSSTACTLRSERRIVLRRGTPLQLTVESIFFRRGLSGGPAYRAVIRLATPGQGREVDGGDLVIPPLGP